uniref:Uncharacterized protein n=1 Tax=Myotis myotis TaxID=51298 RepID=A0A7J7SR53_MYOMY|nr:hypothetical protein mMyoMyo1_009321 [Myotis myotis]
MADFYLAVSRHCQGTPGRDLGKAPLPTPSLVLVTGQTCPGDKGFPRSPGQSLCQDVPGHRACRLTCRVFSSYPPRDSIHIHTRQLRAKAVGSGCSGAHTWVCPLERKKRSPPPTWYCNYLLTVSLP